MEITKQRLQRYMKLVSMFTLCVVSLAGCGGGGGGDGPNGTAQAPSSSAASESAPAASPGTTASGGDSRIDNSFAATQCVTLTAPGDVRREIVATNMCSVPIWIAWCTAHPDSDGLTNGQCRPEAHNFSPTGYSYETNASDVGPGSSLTLTFSSGSGNKVFVGACAYQSPSYAVAHIVKFDTTTIDTNSKSSFICLKH